MTVPVEKRYFQLHLQPLNRAAQRRLRDMEEFRGAAIATQFRDGAEISQIPEVHVAPLICT